MNDIKTLSDVVEKRFTLKFVYLCALCVLCG